MAQPMQTPAAFISYARRDDKAYGGRITGLRQRLERLVGSAIGRDFEIFQDCEGIAWGQRWQSRLDEALEEALFLIPILTPSYFNSEACLKELEAFFGFEERSGQKDRVLPLYLLHTPVFEHRHTVLAAKLRERQYRDWRQLRVDPLSSAKVMRASTAWRMRSPSQFIACSRTRRRRHRYGQSCRPLPSSLCSTRGPKFPGLPVQLR